MSEHYIKLEELRPGILKQILITYEESGDKTVKRVTERMFYKDKFHDTTSSEVLGR